MKSVSIKGIARVDLGKKFAKRLSKEQNVPCVIYGGNEEPIHFYAHENEFRKIVYTPNVYLIDVVVGEKTFKTVMGDIQFHPVTDKIVHIDFLRIFDDQFVKINVHVNFYLVDSISAFMICINELTNLTIELFFFALILAFIASLFPQLLRDSVIHLPVE